MTDTSPVFVGRKDELERLNSLLGKKSASLVVVKGRRRIGKSRLVEEFAKGKRFLVFSGIPPIEGTTAQSQRDVFARQLGAQVGLPSIQAQDWSDLFSLLTRFTFERQVVILFDEISWMGSKDPLFLGKLKNAWDLEFKKNPHLVLIFCGSVSTWIEKNIISSTAFFGRISLYLTLEELPLNDCSKLLDLQGFRGSIYEKFKLLSVSGGIPWYIEQIQSTLNADDNIKNLCFLKDGILFKEFDLIFHDLFERRSEIYQPIVESLAEGSKEFNEISKALKYQKSGALSTYLDDLMQSGFITRDYTWSIKSGKPLRLSHFRLSDNYLRFYLKFIKPNAYKILEDSFKDIKIDNLPGWKTILGLQFENLVLKNRKKIWERLKIESEDIIVNNPFFQRKTTRTPGCQIDYLIQTRFNTLFACEIKFSQKELKSEIIKEMQDKLDRFILPRRFSCWPVLIHVNGVDENVIDRGYFTKVIDFSEFLEDLS
ncbi:MAG: ATPase [Alphaproteobacteria bacterium]|nr:ATPase [Alphaproteobacteria bacterium]MBP9776743.1 ATPase [Alphaproteobacteria bacterium]